jgi:integrase
VPLSDAALATSRRSRAKAISSSACPVSAAQKKTLDAALPLPHWTLHDLRRTADSGMARLRVQPHVIEACLNHRSGVIRGVASVYNRHSYADEKREALALWAAHVTRCVDAFTIIARPVDAADNRELEAA